MKTIAYFASATAAVVCSLGASPASAAPASESAADPTVVSTLVDAGASPAQAEAIAAEDALASLAAAVPSCVDSRYDNPFGPYQDVYVTNDCPVTQRVKVIWAFARDSRCYPIAPGSTVKDHHLNQYGIDRWDGLASC